MSAPVRHPRRWIATALLAVCAVALPACAPEPNPAWRPPPAPQVEGVRIAAAAVAPPSTPGPPVLDADELGLVGGRLRNDALPFAARFVYIPGAAEFNRWVNGLLWSTIGATGVAYAPQAHPVEAGLADRGCVPGSTGWPAAELLSRPETGPVGGHGVAVSCELLGVFDSTIVVTFRVVAGSAEGASADTSYPLLVDVVTGEMRDAPEHWTEEAPTELWRRTVDLLRRQAGGLSAAPVEAPDEHQLALAAEALRTAAASDDGMTAVLPAGLTSPELVGLGVAATVDPLGVQLDADTVREWSTPAWQELRDRSTAPFAGVTAPATSVPVDCALIPCVALTYDDGPSGLTPQLLDALAAARASATFYMIGGYAAANPDTVRRVAAEGHEIGSHTMSHSDLVKLSDSAARAQVHDAAAILRDISGAPVATFRSPYGSVNAAVVSAVGMPAVLWSVDTNDWRDPGPAALFERAVGGVSPGGIILFHDTHVDTVNAAPDIIQGLRNRGFEPVTVTELFGGQVPLGRVNSR